MKTKVLKSVKYATLVLLTLLIGYSCSDDDPVQQIDFNETQWEVVPISIRKADWTWYEDTRRYEASVDLPELTKFIYENGVQFGYVFTGKRGVDERQIMLPHLFTYYEGVDQDGNPDLVYTETISCDFKLGSPTSTVTFYIQTSDLFPINEDFVIDRNFRVVLVW